MILLCFLGRAVGARAATRQAMTDSLSRNGATDLLLRGRDPPTGDMMFRWRAQPEEGFLARSRSSAALFADFYELMAERVFRMFMRETKGDEDRSFELLGETFEIGFAKRKTFRGDNDEQGAAWIWKIAQRVLKESRRRSGVAHNTERKLCLERPPLGDESLRAVEQASLDDEIHGKLNAALKRLPDNQRVVLRLRYVRDLGVDEIAAQLGVSNSVVRTRASRGIKTLRGDPRIDSIGASRRA